MATIQVPGRVRNGAVELSEPLTVPDGTEVVVTVPEAAPATHPALLPFPEGAIGMWADRTEMEDPVEWLRKTREEAWRRRTNPD